MRYFVYLSESKVAMLAPQTRKGRRRKWSYGASAGVGGLGVSAQREPFDPELIDKVEAIEEHLVNQDSVGSVDEPRQYFRGEMDLAWGCFGGHWSTGDIVFFGGMTDQTMLGLGGSTKWVVGHHPKAFPENSSVSMGGSTTPYLMARFVKEFDVEIPYVPMWDIKLKKKRESNAMLAMMRGILDHTGPIQKLSFLAKTLVHSPIDHQYDYLGDAITTRQKVVLGTPIYVTLSQ